MPKYHVTFDRIGGNKSVPPLDVDRANELGMLESVSKYARQYLRSVDCEVVLEPCGTRGYIVCGMHIGGDFNVTVQQ